MPHYKDGTEARTGDIVKGIGYNLPYEHTGLVLEVNASDTCNILVATIGPNSRIQWDGWIRKTEKLPEGVGQTHAPFAKSDNTPTVLAELERGECKNFELVHRP